MTVSEKTLENQKLQKEGRKYQAGLATSLVHVYQRASLSSGACGLGLTIRKGRKKSFIREESCPSICSISPAIGLIVKHRGKGPCW